MWEDSLVGIGKVVRNNIGYLGNIDRIVSASSNDLLFIFYSSLWSPKTSFREAYNNNESGSRYIISKEKRTQQSIETGTDWKVF